ncbi:hypothetical protein HDU81_006146 [Chytriomyces hyalinus]|nr:hypothetical protein HDU81_006146 [Chytriomyces hyalinus]
MPSLNPEEPDEPIYLRHLDSAVTLRDLDALTPLTLNGHLLEGVGEGSQTDVAVARFVQNDSENDEGQTVQLESTTRWDTPWQTGSSDGGNRRSSESSEDFIQAVGRLFDGHRQDGTTSIGGVEMLANLFNGWVERQRLRSSGQRFVCKLTLPMGSANPSLCHRTSNRLERLLRNREDHIQEEVVPSNGHFARAESQQEAEADEQIPQLGEIQPLRDHSSQSEVSASARLSISATRSQTIDGVGSLEIEFPEISRTMNSGRPLPQNNTLAAYTARGRNALSSSSVSGANYLRFSGRHNDSQETTPLLRLQNRPRPFSEARVGREDNLPPRPQTPRPAFVEDAENNLDPVALFESYINAHIDQSVLEAEEKTNQQNQSQNALSGSNANTQNTRHSTEEPHPTDLPCSVTNSKSANHLLQHLIPITIPLEHYSRSLTTHRRTAPQEIYPTAEKPETAPMAAHVYLDPLRRAPSPTLVAETCQAAYSQQYRIATGETGLARLLDANGAPVSPARWEHVDLVMKVLCEAAKAHTRVRSGFGGDESSSESPQQHQQQQQLHRGLRRGGGEETGRNLRRRVRRESGIELGEVDLDGPSLEQPLGFGASRFEARRDSDGAW